ncbi:Alanine--tRNA ligase [Rickettsiales endosymbiont of Paramecium tredecaurelia]|uniref:alanine--tRNA ligase n=1 Tax=Candidatus Sarmatiella mevalonica TaxID=2770581 RepID=UPI001921CD3F|nr:alanine--tRNA ligase [Candidatus Sarmatiella mevalonica]MBL3284438.1 Alanine--tRNA ligase [Candidatus Sarmatiella mevalonica]
MKTLHQIRKTFTNYFVQQGHSLVQSSSLLPHNDPTLMFVNSGMVQFKNVFTGKEVRAYSKATSSQKCIRAGGKHNDLENVGYTARHHTFFEMLGNFSFGNYFKEEAIYYAWDLVTKHFAIPGEKLYVTVYHTDEEAINFWKKIAGLGDDRIIKITTNDNFWSMGDLGPCGPCSEIFYDYGDSVAGGLPGTPEGDGDRYVEIWNMVFMQFEQVAKDQRVNLPKPCIDTGMGLERIASVLQGMRNNYDIDLFQSIICAAQDLFKIKATADNITSYRVIADHIRACTFLISDGVIPANEGRGYVLRRILRRSIRHAYNIGVKDSLLTKIVPCLVDLMHDVYPEIKRAQEFVQDVIYHEEMRFRRTLAKGMELLEQEMSDGQTFSGETAFKLYDTYGFPLDLTQDVLKQRGVSVDLAQFEEQMQQQRERARKAWVGSGDSVDDKIWFDLRSAHGVTEFVGYSFNKIQGQVLALINKQQVQEISEAGQSFFLVSNQSVFYGESGGQLGDKGWIISEDCKLQVVETKKHLGIHVHHCILESGRVKVGDCIQLEIDVEYRQNLRVHHTATHLLHAAIHKILGKHVVQKGSLVSSDRLRFDVSYNGSITVEQILQIEHHVNDVVRRDLKVQTVLMPLEDAIGQGAMALFGEKYDADVRVVSIFCEETDGDSKMDSRAKIDGGSKTNEALERSYGVESVELCGGTHIKRTGEVGLFKIVSEASIATGVRRIEAVAGASALDYVQEQESYLRSIAQILLVSPKDAKDKLEVLMKDRKELASRLESVQMQYIAQKLTGAVVKKGKEDYSVYWVVLEEMESRVARNFADKYNQPGVIFGYVNKCEGQLFLTVHVATDLQTRYSAKDVLLRVANAMNVGLKGGGSVATAQGSFGCALNDLQNAWDRTL